MELVLFFQHKKMNSKNKTIPQLGLVFTTFAWGATFVLVKEALNDAQPFIFAFYRFFLAAIIVIPFALFRNKKIFQEIHNLELKGGILCGIFLYLGYSFQNYGLEITTPSKSAFITSMSILLVPFFVYFIKNRKISFHLWISILIAIIGLYLLLNPSNVIITEKGYSYESMIPNLGDFFTFGCAIFFAVHIIFQGDYVLKKINIVRFFIIQCLSVSILSFFSALILGEYKVTWTFQLINAILITGIIATSLAIFIMVWAQKKLSPSETAIIFSMEPVFASLFSILLGVEFFSLMQWCGAFIVVFAVIYYSMVSD